MNCVRWIAVMTLGSAWIVACGRSAPSATSAGTTPVASQLDGDLPAVHKRGSKKLIAPVGTAGGTLELDNGARLAIPQGALVEGVEVTLAEGAKTTAFANHEYEQAIGPTIEIAPELPLNAPIEVSIPLGKLPDGFDEKDLALGLEVVSTTQRAVQGYGVQTRWDYLPASSKSGRAVAELTQVPGYRVQFVVSKGE